MMKLLLTNALIAEALQEPESAAARFCGHCSAENRIQAWVLASAVTDCARLGFAPDRINALLAGISQIPLNARLNEVAAECAPDFEIGLQIAAARIFKLSLIVAPAPPTSQTDVSFIVPEQALRLDPGQSGDRIDFLNLNLALHPIFNQMDGWFMEIIQNTAFAGGNHVAAFEAEFAEFCECPHAIGVSNGTDALLFGLLAAGIRPGDEVITVPNTFIATTEAISQAGAHPVFVDVLADSYLMNPALIEAKITSRTRAILPVHLYGQVADMKAIMAIAEKHDLLVVEDACQAHGARYQGQRAGTIGDVGCFSMYPGKNLGAFGEAGCVVTSDPEIATRIQCLREHGQNRKYYHEMEGYNGRMDNLQAAALRAKLPFLDGWNERRRRIAMVYSKQLADIPDLMVPVCNEYSAHVFHLYVVEVPDPQALSNHLREQGIYSGFHYPVPLHLQQAYAERAEGEGSYPVSERSASRLISLPMFPELSKPQAERVCTEIKRFLNR